ncbi:division plane positioning ATPase MipZ [Pontixanthobacter aestiaquae]|uniref:AAA family ATPase n=1 Tax=Pontixanthobacter aestiaquae TaxID=1509367 RepID=A0A844Z7S2_9SPHN|nr:division plane positioning ATPase MipZ [Pontixanthobacter aestiaquae]MDN3645879.1 division plane positioning ATPase MipZ [Pontixanthobacter aestiaquae]MXO83127.1 AAA family ATPase [Pontixanthobacter aestiaquae]
MSLENAGRVCDGEHPSVVLADIRNRPEISARVIVFANEKGGVGKSTLAFHTSIALARAGHKILAIDLDKRQRSFDRALENREATARSLGITLPTPRHLVLSHQSGAMLMQEIARSGQGCDTIIIDVAGHDSPIARRAIALADKLITPVNPNFVDLDSVAKFNVGTMTMTGPGSFADLVMQLREERVASGYQPTDWMLIKNRVRRAEKVQLERFNAAIEQLPEKLGLRVTSGLAERVAYRELFLFGLTHGDCRDLPGMAGMSVRDCHEIARLIEEMYLMEPVAENVPPLVQSRKPARSMKRYRQSLRTYIGATKKVPTHA